MSERTYWSPRGNPVRLEVRDDTSDQAIAFSTFGASQGGPLEDEYHLARYHVPHAAIDIGAHAGFVSMAILADNPTAKVVALEPIYENLELAMHNADLNGWRGRFTPLEGAIGSGKTTQVFWDFTGAPHSFQRTNRYIGGLEQEIPNATAIADVPTYSLATLLFFAGKDVDLVKWDCEGCEWTGLADPLIASIPIHVGEWHGDPQIAGLHKVFDASHNLETFDRGAAGMFWAEKIAVPA